MKENEEESRKESVEKGGKERERGKEERIVWRQMRDNVGKVRWR